MDIILKREYSENKKSNSGKYLYRYFDLLVIASLSIACCIFSQCYIDSLKNPSPVLQRLLLLSDFGKSHSK